MPDHTSLLIVDSRHFTVNSKPTGSEPVDCRLLTVDSTFSTLRELEPRPGSSLAVLLALLHPRVAGQEAFLLELLAELQVVLGQRAGDAVADGAGLAGRAAAGDRDLDVEPLGRLRGEERLLDDHLQDVVGEVIVEGALVDRDRAGAGNEPDASHRGLAASRRPMLDFNRQETPPLARGAPNRERQHARLLRLMGVGRPAVDLELLQLAAPQLRLGEHSANRRFNQSLRVLR